MTFFYKTNYTKGVRQDNRKTKTIDFFRRTCSEKGKNVNFGRHGYDHCFLGCAMHNLHHLFRENRTIMRQYYFVLLDKLNAASKEKLSYWKKKKIYFEELKKSFIFENSRKGESYLFVFLTGEETY